MDDYELKKILFTKLNVINAFIRSIENFSKELGIDVSSDRVYIASTAQRQMLRDIIEENSN